MSELSIIIPTYNNEHTIRKCLNSIVEQECSSSVEIIVVDGGSTDKTTDIVDEFDIELINSDSGRAEARIIGAKSSKGQYIYHMDSDMVLADSTLEILIEECRNNVDAMIIPEKNIGSTYWAGVTNIEKRIFWKARTGNARVVKREIYFKAGPHHPELTAKEDEFLHAMIDEQGYNIEFIDETFVYHLVGNISLIEVLEHRRNYTKSLQEYNELGIDYSHDRLFQSAFVVLIREPKYIPGFILLRALITVLRIIDSHL